VVAAALLAGCSFTAGQAAPDARLVDSRATDTAAAPDGTPDGTPDSPPIQGSLTVTSAPATGDIKLTTEGTTDWAQWGHLGTSKVAERKMGVNLISDLAATPGTTAAPLSVTESWTDGSPDMIVSGNDRAVIEVAGSHMDFTASAGTTVQTLRVYVAVQLSSARLDVSLSDASATTAQAAVSNMNGDTYTCITITYNAASNGQTLAVKWTDLADVSGAQHFTMLMAATLQ
jgi:hypothetical protein